MRSRLLLLLPITLLVSACGTATSTSTESASEAADTPGVTAQPSDSGAETASGNPGAGEQQTTEVPASLDFVSRTVDGAEFDGATLAGKPVVLWFWAPWCPTCRGQIDGVSAAAQAHGQEVSFIGVGSLDGGDAIEGFADDVPADEITHLSDPDGEVWRHFGITAQSTYVVLDAEGERVVDGALDDAELLAVVDDLAG